MVRDKCRGCKWLAPTLIYGRAEFVCLKPIKNYVPKKTNSIEDDKTQSVEDMELEYGR